MLRAVSWLGLAVSVSGCGAGALTPLDLDRIEQALGAPTGELERTDARGLAYTLVNARTVLRVLEVAAGALPGIERSPLFEATDLTGCEAPVARGIEVDLPCLGHVSGHIRVRADSELANDNGRYRVTLDRAAVEAGLYVNGAFTMQVEGIANPVAVEKTSLAPTATIDGMPRFFETLEHAGVVVDNTRGSEAVYYVVEVLGETYVAQIDEEAGVDGLAYTVRDERNLWTCTSRLAGREIVGSECRTPVGQGDFAELRF